MLVSVFGVTVGSVCLPLISHLAWCHLMLTLWGVVVSCPCLCASGVAAVEDDGFIAKLPTFEKRCETPAGRKPKGVVNEARGAALFV